MDTETKTAKRPAEAILKELCEAVMEYNSLRDDEWDFEDENGDRSFWDSGTCDTHEELIGEILASRRKVANLLREATGKADLCF